MELNEVIRLCANFNWFEFFGCIFYIVSVYKMLKRE